MKLGYKLNARRRRVDAARRAEVVEERRRWRDPDYIARLVEARCREILPALAAAQRDLD